METTIFGPPGTGKTTTLLNIVDDALQGGMNPSRIGFVSFSKKAATEAKERALQKFGIDPKYLTHFRTLHSMAFQYLGLSTHDVMKGADYTELSTLVGLPFSSHASLTMDDGLLFKAGRGGDAYLNLINLARARQVSVETQYHQLNDWRIQLRQLRVIDGALTSYKSAKGKMDFVDMIEQFVEGGEGPHFDLLIVDEAQDLVPLQWRMVKDILVPRSERTYYAGDDDQCIYSWMGVDVQDFMKSCDDVRVLSKSYRLPAPVYNVAQNIVKRVSLRQEKHWSPNDHDGSVNWHYDILDVDIRSGEWLILGRTNNIVNRVGTMLKEQGFVFWREGRGKNTGGMVTAMQRRDVFIRGTKTIWQVYEEGSYNPGWEATFEQFRPRRNLHSRRHYREVQLTRYTRDTLVAGDQGVGQGGDIHHLSSPEWGEDSGELQAEDSSIDDSCRERWGVG